ncbi:hypothetical protein [Mesorhizobium sp. RMAD-H1]|uniref:hypothetical protein n=1 Tax=Mesorhizobium sp. RMAD-H1 TaxID=2587065 RepID=UPI00160A0ED4|nr:hypothetical protein [Mesorhizobium sp. RMAD-H1]MBB2974212.1 hypothetical protein [Mesorhizobium sp. RMAD-H1]
MSFRTLNERWLHPVSQALMIFGIVALCQPWSFFLHRYGVTLILIGLVGFLITSKIAPASKRTDGGVFDVSDHHEGKA